MDVLRLVIIEKCEVKDIEIGQMMTMAARVDIFQRIISHDPTTAGISVLTSTSLEISDRETIKCHDPSNSNTNIYTTLRVPGEIKRREVEVDLQVAGSGDSSVVRAPDS